MLSKKTKRVTRNDLRFVSAVPAFRPIVAKVKRLFFAILVLAALGGVCLRETWLLAEAAAHAPKTVEQRVGQYAPRVEARLKPYFDRAGVSYPPGKITLVMLKQERRLDLYAVHAYAAEGRDYRFIRSYPILAASGHLGPKLREGDDQVPEGVYGVESLNPNSHYHLALHVNYPNAFDRAQAQADGRTQLGGDIMIHGSNVSIGCVAMGDTTAEDLFVLAAETGLPNVKLLFCPFDFRVTKKMPSGTDLPTWAANLYANLEQNLTTLPLPPPPTETPQ